MLQLLLSQNPDIQKILAFEGAFEKLFNIVTQEGGVEGGVAVRDALACVDTLLRYNPSNQVALSNKLCDDHPQMCSRVTSEKRLFRLSCLRCCYSLRHFHHTSLHLRILRFNSGTLHKSVQMLRS